MKSSKRSPILSWVENKQKLICYVHEEETKITKHCTEIEGDCKCCPAAGLDLAPSNVNKKAWATGWCRWNRTEVVNGCEETARQPLTVLSKVSRIMQCLVRPSNCSPLCRCQLWLAVMHRTVVEFQPVPVQSMCPRWNTRAAYIGKTSCESFGAAHKAKAVGFINTDWIPFGSTDPRMALGIGKSHQPTSSYWQDGWNSCINWTIPFKGEEKSQKKGSQRLWIKNFPHFCLGQAWKPRKPKRSRSYS